MYHILCIKQTILVLVRSSQNKHISYIYFWNNPFLWTELHIKWKLFIRMLIKQVMLIFRYHQSYNTTGQADKLNTKSKNLMIIHDILHCLNFLMPRPQMWNIPQNHCVILLAKLNIWKSHCSSHKVNFDFCLWHCTLTAFIVCDVRINLII